MPADDKWNNLTLTGKELEFIGGISKRVRGAANSLKFSSCNNFIIIY